MSANVWEVYVDCTVTVCRVVEAETRSEALAVAEAESVWGLAEDWAYGLNLEGWEFCEFETKEMACGGRRRKGNRGG